MPVACSLNFRFNMQRRFALIVRAAGSGPARFADVLFQRVVYGNEGRVFLAAMQGALQRGELQQQNAESLRPVPASELRRGKLAAARTCSHRSFGAARRVVRKSLAVADFANKNFVAVRVVAANLVALKIQRFLRGLAGFISRFRFVRTQQAACGQFRFADAGSARRSAWDRPASSPLCVSRPPVSRAIFPRPPAASARRSRSLSLCDTA